ncbi:hypothetical protein RFI_16217 [Reticulomyxa filosa]|uniref:Uncharacterized protein n=1 Tax=Reticulomyxa filosa TaxID=46433 RepID=X6N6Q9_RETFI|nr:hypothetical protein RFI_16217 [Reticulomyxa filosa]|eukprot:ETO20982.1 hypothetical protein RFI_16217 [Reticulomyxa filosa]
MYVLETIITYTFHLFSCIDICALMEVFCCVFMEMKQIAKTWGTYCTFFETSAKENINVTEVYFEMIRKMRQIEAKKQNNTAKKKMCQIL